MKRLYTIHMKYPHENIAVVAESYGHAEQVAMKKYPKGTIAFIVQEEHALVEDSDE